MSTDDNRYNRYIYFSIAYKEFGFLLLFLFLPIRILRYFVNRVFWFSVPRSVSFAKFDSGTEFEINLIVLWLETTRITYRICGQNVRALGKSLKFWTVKKSIRLPAVFGRSRRNRRVLVAAVMRKQFLPPWHDTIIKKKS